MLDTIHKIAGTLVCLLSPLAMPAHDWENEYMLAQTENLPELITCLFTTSRVIASCH